jgi:hypothetical protein
MAMFSVKVAANAEAADIDEMRRMPDEGYANWIDRELFFIDHRDILRAIHGDYPIATTSAQAGLLIEYLKGVKARMEAAGI